ncbi:MAG: hypothetical protein ACREID_05715 [Planctomycetota bacterium]
MARWVLRLSPLAKFGALLAAAGVLLALGARHAGSLVAERIGRAALALGFVLYVVARVRMVRGARKP